MIEPFTYFWLLLGASLFSTGGTGNLPTLHQELIERGWANEQDFVESLAIGQIGPGPSGLWVIGLGYLTYGLLGALMATLAICIPALVVLLVNMLYRRIGAHPATAGFIRGIGLAIIGMATVIYFTLLLNAGITLHNILMLLAAMLLGSLKQVPIIVILLLAGVAGILISGG